MSVDYPDTDYELAPSHWEIIKESSPIDKLFLGLMTVLGSVSVFNGDIGAAGLALAGILGSLTIISIQYKKDRLKAERDHYREQLEDGDNAGDAE